MADYHAVLKRAIEALPESSGSARRAVYQRARAAIVNQLKNYDPPLSPSEITTEQLRLEEAIRKVEADAARVSLGLGPQPAKKDSEPPRPPATPKPAGQAAPEVTVGAGPNGASASVAPAAAGAAERAPESTPDAASAPRPNGMAVKAEAGEDKPAPQKAPETATEAAKPDKPAAPYAAEPKPAADSKPAAEDKSAAAKAEKPAARDDRGPVARGLADASESGADSEFDEGIDIRPSRLPMIAALVAAVIVFGGLAAGLYSQRDALLALFESAPVQETATAPTSETAAPTPTEEERVSSKTSERLLKDDGSPAAPDALAVTTTRIVPPAEGENGAGAEPQAPVREVTPQAPAAEQAEPPAETAVTALPAIPPAEPPAARGTGSLLVAQRAILYEEGDTSESTGSAAQGQVAWTTVQEPAAGSDETDTVLKANVTIPDRNIAVAVSIRPNRDASLPASHLIEVQFTLPAEFGGKGIANVPGLIMKTTEEARGDALIGASVRVDSGFFWVALSSLEQERQRNETLLRDRGWIDIPILYESGKRAILTLEKGDAGEKAVQTALEAWTQSKG